MANILVFGTVLYDHIGDQYYIGGCHTNVAAHCARLGMDTTMVSCVGADAIGAHAKSWLEAAGVRSEYLLVDPSHPTGTVEVDISDPENPKYTVVDDVAYDHISLETEALRALAKRRFDYMYFGTFEQKYSQNVETLNAILRDVQVSRRFCDINLRENRYTKEIVESSMRAADILKVNEEEFALLKTWLLEGDCDDSAAAEKLRGAYDIEIIIVTRSGRGASAYWADGQADVPAVPVNVVDSVGAGDAFAAAFINALARSGDI